MNRRTLFRSLAAAAIAVPLSRFIPEPQVSQYGTYFLSSDVVEFVGGDPLDQVWSLGWKAAWAEGALDDGAVLRLTFTESE